MAGIEKVCEVSGICGSFSMYGYKHNHIQVVPKYRKQFRKARHVLVIRPTEYRVLDKNCSSTFNKDDERLQYIGSKQEAPFFDGHYHYKGPGYYEIRWNSDHRSGYYTKKVRIVLEYEYLLYCPDIEGQVKGFYYNHSTDIASVKRRLKRMIGDLNVVVANSFETLKSKAQNDFTLIYNPEVSHKMEVKTVFQVLQRK